MSLSLLGNWVRQRSAWRLQCHVQGRAAPVGVYRWFCSKHGELGVPVHVVADTTPVRYRPVSFYRLTALSKNHVKTLKADIEKQLGRLGVTGRIYLAPEEGISGINCQAAVPVKALGPMRDFFDGLGMGPFSYTEGLYDLEEPCFRKLRVLIKENLVAIRDVLPAQTIVVQDQQHLEPSVWHQELKEKGADAVVVDMRNHYEYEIGRFENAIKMDVDTFREGMDDLEKLVQQNPDKDIYAYCTGGIRCDVASSYFRSKGFGKNLKMLKGGINAYGQYIKSKTSKDENDESLFRGKNFTFDDRRGERITHDVLAHCYQCGSPCDTLHNCANTQCHLLFVQCAACRARMEKACSDLCKAVMAGKETWTLEYDYHRQIRPTLAK